MRGFRSPEPEKPFRQGGDTAVEGARRGILELVLAGTFRGGERLPTEALAARLGMSRTPVREALRQLAADGLVEMVPRGGARLVCPTSAEVLETSEIRGHLEALAVRKAAERLTPVGEARLEACLAEEEHPAGPGDPEGMLLERLTLHRVIAEVAQSPVLAETLEIFFRRTAVYALLLPLPEEELRASAREHREIVEALKRRDPDRAEALIRAHVSLQGAGDVALLQKFCQHSGDTPAKGRDRP